MTSGPNNLHIIFKLAWIGSLKISYSRIRIKVHYAEFSFRFVKKLWDNMRCNREDRDEKKGAFTAVKRCSVLKKVCERVRVPFANKRYKKRAPFLTNMVCKRARAWI